jgi:hypothetical protein
MPVAVDHDSNEPACNLLRHHGRAGVRLGRMAKPAGAHRAAAAPPDRRCADPSGSGLGPDARRHRSRAQRARKNVTEHLTMVLLEDGEREGSARTRMHRGKLEGMMRLLGTRHHDPLGCPARRARGEEPCLSEPRPVRDEIVPGGANSRRSCPLLPHRRRDFRCVSAESGGVQVPLRTERFSSLARGVRRDLGHYLDTRGI